MDAYKSIITHRAVRDFQETPIPEEALHRILQAGRMSGSSKNTQPWTFIVIRERATLEALSKCGNFAQHLLGAPLAIAIVFDPQYYRGEFDSGRAAQNMMLAAWAHGVGSCIASMHREEDARNVLGAPHTLRLQHVISFGYPIYEADGSIKRSSPLRGRRAMEEIVRHEKW
jgi:nitroreductase